MDQCGKPSVALKNSYLVSWGGDRLGWDVGCIRPLNFTLHLSIGQSVFHEFWFKHALDLFMRSWTSAAFCLGCSSLLLPKSSRQLNWKKKIIFGLLLVLPGMWFTAVIRWRVPSERFHFGSARMSWPAGTTTWSTGFMSNRKQHGTRVALTLDAQSKSGRPISVDFHFILVLWVEGRGF